MTTSDDRFAQWTFPDDIAHGIELSDIYDGVCVWVMKDGALVNRFRLPGYEGWEWRAEKVDEWLELHREVIRREYS